ncbi:Putative cation diffusion facilitator family transporter, magnetosome protein MamB (homolog to MamM) [Desulfamplus magnetovallimortis]|uniref:Magnetosome protein n=2 Tax=Desulfamplus magnetovallimortis TaxID=1246637 RepID=G8IQT7_9BACT|nr:cation diffusion facilitator family transporter [Desulfamplus magnetovallimortis]AET24910.1 magnetosome protein [Desulfamplus magnetovallimortis BW-1]CCO06712.1 Putative cation diffusion facilitator family transporter, magnetosome protein MamB (homolog to MamM) [Desulfamplus magnetovallimortis BW-1]SLM32763.1 Putative cation diffusion facilitator family transporter, magnetosome protein MamB (homolog to MamM) [Desulfamplus magnetovallimortis]
MRTSNNNNNEKYPECYWCAENVGKIAFWGNVGLFVLKIICGLEGNSKALLADAVHSGVDVVTATVVLVCLHVSNSPADDEHPYGHGNTEYIASLFIGISLMGVVALILYESITDIMQGVTHQPTLIALLGLMISIVGNELMFRQSLCCGERFKSPAMIANAWENRADVLSSIAALLGVIFAMMGFLFMDSVGAILVAFLIGKSAFEMLQDAWDGILDHSEESVEETVRHEVEKHADVLSVASLQTRKIGPNVAIDLKLAVSPDLTLQKGHEISVRVKRALLTVIDDRVGIINVYPTGFYEKG